jgi:RNA polymerase sigma-70 factor, ECF subfamily
MAEGARTVTSLLRDWRDGDRAAAEHLMPLVYDELRAVAARHLAGERPGSTVRPTDLVSEAYLKLAGGAQPEWNDRVHFFAIAARLMRQILVDRARKRRAEKRGGDERPVTLDAELVVAPDRAEGLLALDQALEELAAFDERKARAIELHYFAGLTQPEIALALEVHVNTVARDLKLAEAWLHRALQRAE